MEKILSEVPFKFKGIHYYCEAIAIMPISFNFTREMLDFTRVSLGIGPFDVFGITGFPKKMADESKTVVETISLAQEKHLIKKCVLFQHTDFFGDGNSNRFSDRPEEDFFHKKGLIDSGHRIVEMHPGIEPVRIYARLNSEQTEIVFSEVFEDG